jgi:hypothetical protein
MDNASEFSLKALYDYCMALGINVEHSIPNVHTQNGLAESLIKRVKLIACHADCIFDEDNFLALGETICTITNARK